MLKWFGFESGASEGDKSATNIKKEETQSNPSDEDNRSGAEKCISEGDKEEMQDEASSADETTKSNNTPSMSGAFGKYDITFELNIHFALPFCCGSVVNLWERSLCIIL